MTRSPTSGADRPHPERALLLLGAIVAFVLVQPAQVSHPRLVDLAETAMITAAVVVCVSRGWTMWSAVALGVPAAALSWLEGRQALDAVTGLSAAFTVLLYVLVLVLMLRRIFRTRAVSGETVALAVASYMMTAIVWSIAYALLELWHPGAFSCFPDGVRPPGWQIELVYFSFVTMTTLGYGDVTPVLPLARSLAILQAVTGTMFLGVLIAGLVGRVSGSRGDA